MMIRRLHINAEQKFLATAAGAAAILALAGWGFGRMVAEIRQGDAARAALREGISEFAEDRRQLRLSEGLLHDRKDDLDRIGRFFVDRTNPLLFIEAVEQAAAAAGAIVVMDADEGASGSSALRFRLTAQGRDDALLGFVRMLETLPYAIDMRDMSFQNESSASGGDAHGSRARLLLSLDVATR